MAQTDSELRHRTRCIGYSILATLGLIPTPDDRYSDVYVFLRYAIQLGDRRDVIPEVSIIAMHTNDIWRALRAYFLLQELLKRER